MLRTLLSLLALTLASIVWPAAAKAQAPGIGGIGIARPAISAVGPTGAGAVLPTAQYNLGVLGGFNVASAKYGAVADAIPASDGVMTAGSPNLNSASSTFPTSICAASHGGGCTGMRDATISVHGAGAAGANLVTTVIGWTDAHDVVLAANAATAVPFFTVAAAHITTRQSGAGSYTGGATLTLSGGTFTTAATFTVKATDVVSATVAAGGTSCRGASPLPLVFGTTGTGAYAAFLATVSGGAITATTLAGGYGGRYLVNPTDITQEPITGDSCSGSKLNLVMGVESIRHGLGGIYSVKPANPVATTSSDSGTGMTITVDTWVTTGDFVYGTQNEPAFQSAVNDACASGGGLVYAPPGKYLIDTTSASITETCSNVTVAGSGNTTVLRHVGTGDLFYAAFSPVSQYLSGANFRNLGIFRTDNPTSGTGIHMNDVSNSNLLNVSIQGEYTNYQGDAILDVHCINCTLGGDNWNDGASLALIDTNVDSGPNSSENVFLGGDQRAQHQNSYTYGLWLRNSDGLKLVGGHWGFTLGPAVYLNPQYIHDQITAFDPTGNIFDGGGIQCDSLPGSYAGTMGNFVWGGNSIEFPNGAGYFNACTSIVGVTAPGTKFAGAKGPSIVLAAGSDQKFQNSTLKDSGQAGWGEAAAVLGVINGGNQAGADISGATYIKTGATALASYLDIYGPGSAVALRQNFKGSTTNDWNVSSTGAPKISVASTDHAVTCAGTTVTCSISSNSTPDAFQVTFSPTGSPPTTDSFTLTLGSPAANSWNCQFNLASGSAGWNAAALIHGAGSFTNGNTFGGVWNNTAALTAGQSYNAYGRCIPM